MTMKGNSIFSDTPGLECHILDTCYGMGFFPSAEIQSAYSLASADWAEYRINPILLSVMVDGSSLWRRPTGTEHNPYISDFG